MRLKISLLLKNVFCIIKKEPFKAALFSLFIYIVFFYPQLFDDKIIYFGGDTLNLHYPSRFYLYERLQDGQFPFWTERIFGGFPLYASLERSYLNPLNLVLIYFLGPINSFILMHFLIYSLGVYGMYLLCKELGMKLSGFFVAMLTYFYSFFHLFHQQHINIVFTTYLIPLLIFLSWRFFKCRKKYFLLFSAFIVSFTFYMGSFQSVLILAYAQLLFIFFYIYKNKKFTVDLKSIFKYLLFQYALIFIITLPGVLISLDLFSSSIRLVGPALYRQGSITPAMLLNAVIPYIFGLENHELFTRVNLGYYTHEIYIYSGIASFLLGCIAFLLIKDKNLKRFCIALIVSFYLLSASAHLPILKDYLLFPFSVFRYWVRSVVLFNFAMALMAGMFFSEKNLKINFKENKYLWWIFITPAVLFILSINSKETQNFLWLIKLKGITFDGAMLGWLFIVIYFFTLYAFFYLKRVDVSVFKIFLLLLVSFDLVFFGQSVAGSSSFILRSELNSKIILQGISSKERTLDLTGAMTSTDHLYRGYWGVLGYDALAPKHASEQAFNLGLSNSQYIQLKTGLRISDVLERARTSGIEKIITHEGLIDTGTNYPVKNANVPVNELIRDEGHLKFEIYLKRPTTLKTYVVNDNSWVVTVDEKSVSKLPSPYIEFNLEKGIHVVEMNYVPRKFYLSLLASLLLLFPYYYVYKKLKF